MSKWNGQAKLLKLYKWAHQKWPKYLDCRPIYVGSSLRASGYEIKGKEKVRSFGLPVEIVLAIKPA